MAYKVSVEEEFEQGELAEVYNLVIDPMAFYNIKDVINKSDISYLLDALKQRHSELKKEVSDFIVRLNNGR